MAIRVENHWQNEELDSLQKGIEYSAVLSIEFKNRILSHIHWFGTNGWLYKDDALQAIKDIKEDMSRTSIFSEKFITEVSLKLEFGLMREITKRSKSEKSLV